MSDLFNLSGILLKSTGCLLSASNLQGAFSEK